MKILYFGTVCNFETFNEIMEQCNTKSSFAPIIFETALLNGLQKNGVEIEILSYPMVPYFPNSKKLCFGGMKEKLECGYDCYWLKTINLPFVKQFTRRLDARRYLKKWLETCNEGDIVFTYSIPPFLVKDIIELCEKKSIKKFAIIPDLLRDMYINEKKHGFFAGFKEAYINSALQYQDKYDGYIYLTDQMNKVVAPGKPYTVMEGIANIEAHVFHEEHRTNGSKAIMYAGMLHEKYGIINLLDAFERIKSEDVELWLFGEGTALQEVVKRSKLNKNIKYFGVVDHKTILEYEKKASILVNPRNPKDSYTKYSFPSKTIEYMLSGTPVLTTKLEGIPKEYDNYIFFAEDNSPEKLADAMQMILSLSEEKRNRIGNEATQFILKEKNSIVQTQKIISFIEEVLNDSQNKNE